MEDTQKINKLAETLKNSGLAASMTEAVRRAKEIIGVETVPEVDVPKTTTQVAKEMSTDEIIEATNKRMKEYTEQVQANNLRQPSMDDNSKESSKETSLEGFQNFIKKEEEKESKKEQSDEDIIIEEV